MDNRTIAICIYTYQQFEKLLESFKEVVDDNRVAEIVICDDFSEQKTIWKIEDWLQFDAPEKIRLCQNTKHIGEDLSKHTLAVMADSEYIVLMNAEERIRATSIDMIFETQWEETAMLKFDGNKIFMNREFLIENFKP
jgi:glycosyltransferase involved in cell wall biosynthesis